MDNRLGSLFQAIRFALSQLTFLPISEFLVALKMGDAHPR
jgi:hypothetical protein